MDQKQTVVIFSTAYLPFLGGAELAIKEITDRIHDLDFVVITARMRRDLPHQERIGNVEVCRMGFGILTIDKLLSPFLAAWHLSKLMRVHRVCLFWSVMVSYVPITPVLLKMAGFYKRIPFLLTLQEGDSEQYISRGRFGLIAFWWRTSLWYADYVQVISAYLERLARDFGYKGLVTVVPNGVDVDKFKVQSSKFKVGNTRTIITVSRLVEKNGVDILIRAFEKVHKEFPFAELHIVGDGSLREELKELSHNLGIANNVKFFGAVPYESVPAHLHNADIFVRPSRSEGLGTAFLEAMAIGLPIVATRVGGIPDFLEDEKTGLFAIIESSEDIARQIKRLLTDEALYNKLSHDGRELVRAKYSWEVIYQNMKTIFTNLIET